ncbi:ABC transporter permease, partial [Streptomyces turgidiscabies]|uniref:ABC transporter permease n=1 Tax=Streptomyces turgidiscabies TaxID=85558 RepID=UPI0038F5EAF8
MFGIRILGSSLGFLALLLCSAAMTATFGLLVSTIGRSETQSRGISILIILVTLATGGAWFPMSQMPRFVQKAAEFLPVRWVV